MGRKTKLTPSVREAICEAVEQGANVAMRCYNAGIVKQTYLNWIARGEKARAKEAKGEAVADEERPYLAFLDAIDDAKANYGVQLQQVIYSEALRDPVEARRELQRLYPEDYAPPAQRVEATGKDGGPVVHEHRGETHGDVEHLAAVLATLVGVGAVALPDAGGDAAAEDDALHR